MYAAHMHAAQIDLISEQDAIDDREAIVTEPIVDDEFGNNMVNTKWIDVNLPDDTGQLSCLYNWPWQSPSEVLLCEESDWDLEGKSF
jgi:hypothetical protein